MIYPVRKIRHRCETIVVFRNGSRTQSHKNDSIPRRGSYFFGQMIATEQRCSNLKVRLFAREIEMRYLNIR
jgi:hypothetical protein